MNRTYEQTALDELIARIGRVARDAVIANNPAARRNDQRGRLIREMARATGGGPLRWWDLPAGHTYSAAQWSGPDSPEAVRERADAAHAALDEAFFEDGDRRFVTAPGLEEISNQLGVRVGIVENPRRDPARAVVRVIAAAPWATAEAAAACGPTDDLFRRDRLIRPTAAFCRLVAGLRATHQAVAAVLGNPRWLEVGPGTT